MIEAFKKYVSNYDMEIRGIKLKYEHSFRVMSLSEKYALKLNFSEEDVYLAKLIGLLHDIGRFEQMKVYNTFVGVRLDKGQHEIKMVFYSPGLVAGNMMSITGIGILIIMMYKDKKKSTK